MYKMKCAMYRYATYKQDVESKVLLLNNIGYSNNLTYSSIVTNIYNNDKLGTYKLEIDRSTDLVDISQKLIFENDYVKNNKNEIYIVEKNSKGIQFVEINNKTTKNINYNDIKLQNWKVIGNKHENSFS